MTGEKMQRVISLPEGFTAVAEHNSITLKSAKGETTKKFKASGISFKVQNSSIVLEGRPASRRINALLQTIASHIGNMAAGLQQQFQYKLAVVYSHFPMNVTVKGNVVEINNFTGEKFPRYAKILPNVSVQVKGKEITVSSADKEAAGQTVANLENATKVKGKDRRIYQDGIFVVQKAKRPAVGGREKHAAVEIEEKQAAPEEKAERAVLERKGER